MSFEVSVTPEAHCVRIAIQGDPRLGRLLSLLQVVEIDSRSWQRDAVLLDLRGLQMQLSDDDQVRLAEEAARALRRMRKIAVLAPAGGLREAAGVRVFDSEAGAQRWLGQP